jgi:hypothetical protein
MLAQSGSDTRALKPGEAQVILEDGRTFEVKASIDPPRPSAALISKTVQWAGSDAQSTIHLANESELPLEARLTFSLHAQSPAGFSPDEKLEVATTDGSFSAVLAVSTGEMKLESRKTAVVTLDPSRALGASAFGPVQFRRVVGGVAGDWTPLATLVRLPKLAGVDCPSAPEAACSLRGADLYLLESVSVDTDFAHSIHVPDGFTEPVLRIPHPLQGEIYFKLRDDPATVNVAFLNVRTAASPSTDGPPLSPGPEHLRDQPSPATASAAPAASAAVPSAPPSSASGSKPEGSITSQPAITAAKGPPAHEPP